MYVVKVGEFYVNGIDVAFGGFVEEISLSKKLMRGFNKEGAERIAKMIKGEVIEMAEEVTNE